MYTVTGFKAMTGKIIGESPHFSNSGYISILKIIINYLKNVWRGVKTPESVLSTIVTYPIILLLIVFLLRFLKNSSEDFFRVLYLFIFWCKNILANVLSEDDFFFLNYALHFEKRQ